MKAIKLLAIFLLIMGAVAGAFFLFSSNGGSEDDSTKSSSYVKVSAEIEKNWQQCADKADSIKSLFEHKNSLLDEYKNNDIIESEEEITRLKHNNARLAIEKIKLEIFELWKTDNCQKTDVDKYHAVLKNVQTKDDNARNNEDLKKINEVYEVYKNAYALAHLNTDEVTSDTDKQQKKKQIQNIRANQNYKEYLEHIDDLNKGLKRTESKLSASRSSSTRRSSHRHRRSSRSSYRARNYYPSYNYYDDLGI